jgi:hypothetical protein
MADEQVLINGKAYSFSQIVLKLGGVEIASCSAVEYTEEQAKANNYGTGKRPVSRGEAITVSMNDIEAIRDIAPDGSLLRLGAFDVQVTFQNTQKVVTHVIKNCEFLNDGVEASVDDTDIKKKFDLIPSHIKYR